MSRPKKVEWDAGTYHRVSLPQQAWGQRVLARLPPLAEDAAVLDVGCGTGKVSAELMARVPRGRLVALDRSAQMIDGARSHLDPLLPGRVGYLAMDVLDLTLDREIDLIFSTATFHWVVDHVRLFDVLFRALRPGGWLVAQCGGLGNLARVYERAEPLLSSGRLGPYFEGWTKPVEYASPETTRTRLAAAGFTEIETGLEDAPTPFRSASELAEFLSSVIFVTHLDRLPDLALRGDLIRPLVETMSKDEPPFVLDYKRLNIKARRPGG
jgi:trans-aconitate 2-methyltransferase